MTPEAILTRLAEIRAQIEVHHAAVFLLEQERLSLHRDLRASGWVPPQSGTTE